MSQHSPADTSTSTDVVAFATLLSELSANQSVLVLDRFLGDDYPAQGWWIPSGLEVTLASTDVTITGQDPNVVEDEPGDQVFFASYPVGSTYDVATDRRQITVREAEHSTEFYFVPRAAA